MFQSGEQLTIAFSLPLHPLLIIHVRVHLLNLARDKGRNHGPVVLQSRLLALVAPVGSRAVVAGSGARRRRVVVLDIFRGCSSVELTPVIGAISAKVVLKTS